MELLREAPELSAFVSLADHQSQTPASFFAAPPVLHFKSTSGRLVLLSGESGRNPAFQELVKDSTTHGESILTEQVDIWVSSEKLILWRPSISTGVAIPYPSISLHALGAGQDPSNPAVRSQALYLEIITNDGFDDHDEEGSMAINYIPGERDSASESETPPVSTCQQLYDAVTDCANLHPDPVSPSSSQAGDEGEEGEEDDESGPIYDYEVIDSNGLPPALSSSGWITSENMNQFFDEEGNWRAGGLGPGAGLVRTRDEDDNEVNGSGQEVNGEGEETKWRRTEDP